MVLPAPEKRFQIRLSFDSKLGPLWDWLSRLTEGERRVQVMFLIQLGFEAREGVRNMRERHPGGQVTTGGQRDESHAESVTLESTDSAARALGAWANLADMAAPPP